MRKDEYNETSIDGYRYQFIPAGTSGKWRASGILCGTEADGKSGGIAISTNDALGAGFKNIAMLMNMKNIYFVPFGQDNYKSKPNSMVAPLGWGDWKMAVAAVSGLIAKENVVDRKSVV